MIEIETDTDISWKSYRRHSKSYVTKLSDKLIKLVKIHSAEVFSLGTIITQRSSFDIELIQNKFKF